MAMVEPQIRYEDPAGYERYMGVWSRLVGERFLDWLKPRAGLRWIDIGCGNGAFTELIVERCAPAAIQGIDPSEAQLAFARGRPAIGAAEFRKGDAMTLPFPDGTFDVAVMALAIFFVPEPAQGVAEMVRTVRPGGLVATYIWDMLGGGFPLGPIQAGMRDLGLKIGMPPRTDASQMEALRGLWAGAGLDAIESREITVRRTFADFEEFWQIALLRGDPVVGALTSAELEQLKARVRGHLPAAAADGRITTTARANAIKGRISQ